MWVKKEDESEIKKAFEMTLAVRKLNIQARELSDKYFFETLVRIHRAGEGEAYTGLKPAGSEVEPGIVAADRAVETGSIDNLVKEISAKFTAHIHNHFKTLLGKKKHMDGSVEAGREFVEAYVTFIHYVERLYLAVAGDVMQASDGILAVNKDGFICFWNKYAGEIFGYSKDNVVGCSLNMIIPEKHRQRHWDAFFNVMKTGKSKYAAGEKLSVPALTKDGKTVPFNIWSRGQ